MQGTAPSARLFRNENYRDKRRNGIICRGGQGKELDVDAVEVRRLLLQNQGLRIEPEMSRYLADRLAHSSDAVAVMGGDARTGMPVIRLITPVEVSHSRMQQGFP